MSAPLAASGVGEKTFNADWLAPAADREDVVDIDTTLRVLLVGVLLSLAHACALAAV